MTSTNTSTNPQQTRGTDTKTHGTGRGLTFRAAAVGLAGVILLCAVTPYNDYRLDQTLLYGNHFPIGCLFLFTFLVLVVNTAIRRFSPGTAFKQQELLMVWIMLITGSGLASSGLMRYVAPMLLGPFYFASETNRWESWSRHIPDWMIPGRDPKGHVVKWFFEGVPDGHSVPWQPWVHVFFTWGLLFAFVVGISLCLSVLLRRHWVERERLAFPLVHIPIEMSREPEKGLVNSFFTNRVMWAGVAFAVAVHGLNGLHSFYYSIPSITLRWEVWQAFPTRPWNAISLWTINLYFSVVGIAFMLPTEVSFSLWAFFLAFRLMRVFRASVGMDPINPVTPNHEVAMSTGGFIAWTIWMVWGARAHLAGIWRKTVESPEPMRLRTAAVGALVCFLGLVGWTTAAGMAPLFGVLMWGCFVVILMCITRAVAESGMLFVQSAFFPTDVLSAIPGSRIFNASGLGVAMMTQTAIIHDPREALMPSLMNSLKLKGEGRGRDIIIGILMAVAVGYIVSFISFVGTCYRYGAVTMDPYGCVSAPRWFYGQINRYIESPRGLDYAALGNVAIGAAFTGLLLFLRSNAVLGVPHPIGFFFPVTYAILTTWFSIFVAWCLKTMVLRFGGLKLFRTVLPFFLGLVIGEGITAAVWVVVGMITGVSMPVFLPI